MTTTSSALDALVTSLTPSLSRSLAEHFNVFRVMRHGTHEKQLSNVFAWLLSPKGSHGLGDAFQRIFVELVNAGPPAQAPVPPAGYRVTQEVDTSGGDANGKDIADIVLTRRDTSIVVENFESSDGHGHDYKGYLSHGEAGGRRSVVVLLCPRHEPHRQTDGWQKAVVVTYRDALERLRTHVATDRAWREAHPEQNFFIGQLVDQFVEGTEAVSTQDRIAFMTAMCETGEAARYGYRPQSRAAQEFGDLLARHAVRQFEDGRRLLADVKVALKRYAEHTLVDQVNGALPSGGLSGVEARFSGQWEWCVTLRRGGDDPAIYLEFGPTAAVENARVAEPVAAPDYGYVFVTRQHAEGEGTDLIAQTEVMLSEVLDGLPDGDTRLCDAVLATARR